MVDEKSTLQPVQKLQYLKLLVGGEAENLIKHFQVTNDNYQSAWKLLKDRYHNLRVLVNEQLKTLLNQRAVTHETAQGIKGILDTTTECLLALKNLKIPIEQWDALIVYVTVQKLPPETHSLWEQQVACNVELSSWDELKEFLECRFRALEAISLKKSYNSNKVNKGLGTKSVGAMQALHSSSNNPSANFTCDACGDQHHIRACFKFAQCQFSKKLEIVKQKGLCMNCLGTGHLIVNCPSKQKCYYCKKRHHTLLHKPVDSLSNSTIDTVNPTVHTSGSHCASFSPQETCTSSVNPQTNAGQSSPSTLSISSPAFMPQNQPNLSSFFVDDVRENREILLATALINVVAPSGQRVTLRALIDQGSQATFVTESVVQALKLKKEAVCANISGVEQATAGQVNARVKLILQPRNNDATTIEANGLVLKRLTHLLPPRKIKIQNWKHLQGLELADPSFHQPGKIDILLGADIYSKIIQHGLVKGDHGSPLAQKTLFGWILSGELKSSPTDNVITTFHILAELDNQIRKFWEVEEIQGQVPWTDEEKLCEEIFSKTCKRLPDGRYEVALPLKNTQSVESLGESRKIAVSRLLQMEKKFEKDSALHKDYANCLQEYLTMDHMQPTSSSSASTPYCYLPHHAVLKQDSATTKLRVVFDASRKTSSGSSLNDILLKGPVVPEELACLLMRWRKYRIAFSADLEKMYRQVRVKPEHTDLQRIVWRSTANTAIQDYRLLTVTFGTKSAPYLATRVLKQLALDEQRMYPLGAQTTLTEFYVDDLLSGADDEDTALEKQRQLISLLKSGGFNLRKWASNDPSILRNVGDQVEEHKVALDADADRVKALGLYWDPARDVLCYSLKLEDISQTNTKRTICQTWLNFLIP